MALLIAANTPDQEPSFGGRGIMRSSGVRRPWMPAPLADLTTGIVRGAAIVTMAAAMALPGANVWMPRPLDAGAPPPPELRVLPPTVLVNQPGQPGANVAQLFAPRDQIAPPPERLSPPLLISGQQPQPVASFWAPTPARTPNIDPLRPLAVVANAPAGTLAQPSAHAVGRLSRAEDVQWPARRAIAQTGAQPLPQARAATVGAVLQSPDRLTPPCVIGAQPQPPAATVAQLTRPQDQEVIAPERLALTTAIVQVSQPPAAIVRTVGAVRETPAVLEPRAAQPTQVITPAREQPGALAVWTRGGVDGTSPPIPPVDLPYQGDAYIYDVDGPIGTVTGGTILPNGGLPSPTGGIDGGTVQAGPDQASPTGSVSGGTIQPGPNQTSATGAIDGGTVLPPETII